MKIAQLERDYNLTDPKVADDILARYMEVYDAITAGTARIRYIDGDRKGSIAIPVFRHNGEYRPKVEAKRRYSGDPLTYDIGHCYFFCDATWEGRKNKVQVTMPSREVEVLLGYEGPTIWEKFDAKAAKVELLKNPDQKDIYGKVLSIGDPVLYINARYGSRMVLTEGKIVEFKVSVDSSGHTFATIIESLTGEQSSLQYPEDMVYKK